MQASHARPISAISDMQTMTDFEQPLLEQESLEYGAQSWPFILNGAVIALCLVTLPLAISGIRRLLATNSATQKGMSLRLPGDSREVDTLRGTVIPQDENSSGNTIKSSDAAGNANANAIDRTPSRSAPLIPPPPGQARVGAPAVVRQTVTPILVAKTTTSLQQPQGMTSVFSQGAGSPAPQNSRNLQGSGSGQPIPPKGGSGIAATATVATTTLLQAPLPERKALAVTKPQDQVNINYVTYPKAKLSRCSRECLVPFETSDGRRFMGRIADLKLRDTLMVARGAVNLGGTVMKSPTGMVLHVTEIKVNSPFLELDRTFSIKPRSSDGER